MEVYDKGNPDRLLGYINKDIKVQGKSYLFDIRGNTQTITLYFHPKWTSDHVNCKIVFITDDTLSDLLNYQNFLLPNETPDIAANRRYLG